MHTNLITGICQQISMLTRERPVPTPEELRKIVVEALRESELPRTLLARDAQLGRATLESWVAGLRNPSEESVAQVASALEGRGERLQRLAGRLRSVLAENG